MTSIKLRLQLALLFIVGVFLLQGVVFYASQNQVRGQLETTVKTNTQVSAKLSSLAVSAQQVRRYEKEFFIYVADVEMRTKYIKEWTGTFEKIEALVSDLSGSDQYRLSADEIKAVQSWKVAASFYGAEMGKIFQLVSDKNSEANITLVRESKQDTKNKLAVLPELITPNQANQLIGPGKDMFSSVLIKGVNELNALKTQEVLKLSSIVEDGVSQLGLILLALLFAGMFVVAFLLATLPPAITGPIAALSQAADTLSKGDALKPIPATGTKEFQSLTNSMERLRLSQQLLVERVGR
jgi:methyl-accepting chemotaxis protein